MSEQQEHWVIVIGRHINESWDVMIGAEVYHDAEEAHRRCAEVQGGLRTGESAVLTIARQPKGAVSG